ncbi:MAG: type 4a pilus biogenesis protein PilO [Nitrospinales bacterium]
MEKLFDKLPYDKLSNIKFTHLLAGAFGLGVLLFVAFHLTLYGLLQIEFDSLQTKKSQTEDKLKNYRALIEKEDEMRAKLAAAQGELAQIKSQLPSRQEIVNFLRQVSEIGTSLGLNIVLIRSLPEETNDFYKETPIKIDVQGGFYKTMGFLDAVQNLLHLVNLTQMKIESIGPEGAKLKPLTTSSVAVAYSYVEGAEDRPATKPKKKNT